MWDLMIAAAIGAERRRASADNLQSLSPGYLQHYQLSLTDGRSFFATLFVIEREELDFEFDLQTAVEAGGLEMF